MLRFSVENISINEPEKKNVRGYRGTLEMFRVHLTPHTSLSLEIVIRAGQLGEMVRFHSDNVKALGKFSPSSTLKTLQFYALFYIHVSFF